MLNAPKPVHINLTLNSGSAAGATVGLYTYETVPDGTVALKVTVPGMGAGANPSVGSKATWRKGTYIWLRTLNTTNDIAVSFDNGNNFITISKATGAGVIDTFESNITFRHFYIKSVGAAGDIAAQCIVGINQS